MKRCSRIRIINFFIVFYFLGRGMGINAIYFCIPFLGSCQDNLKRKQKLSPITSCVMKTWLSDKWTANVLICNITATFRVQSLQTKTATEGQGWMSVVSIPFLRLPHHQKLNGNFFFLGEDSFWWYRVRVVLELNHHFFFSSLVTRNSFWHQWVTATREMIT